MPKLVDPGVSFKSPVITHSGTYPAGEILPQQLFLRTLCLERKRAERAGRRLVLMLLESDILQADHNTALTRILLSLSQSTRDTDITGWYREGAALGVLFTEIGATEKPIVEILSRKVRDGLRRAPGTLPLHEIDLSFYVFPDDCEELRSGISMLYPDLVNEIDSKRAALAAKRCIDVLASFLALLLLAPLLVAIASLVKLTSRGPVFFRQKRLGQYGAGFTFLKFRSMYAEADQSVHEEYVKRYISSGADCGINSSGQNIYKIKGDARITRVGRFLRRTSLDELPQLLNVLVGQMSLVGPRPPLPYEFESYEIWHKRRLLAVKPGITGFWQVEGRSRVKFDDMVRMDLAYARSWSLWLDIKILLQTPRAVFNGDGAL